MTPGSDEALMGALAAGDDAALNPLMDRWQVPLRRFLYRFMQNEHDALDLAQETLVRLYQHRSRYRAGARFSTWMFQIALNLARSRARWVRRHPTDSPDGESETPNPKLQTENDATPSPPCPANCAPQWCCSNSRTGPMPRSRRSCAPRRRWWRPGSIRPASSCERCSPSIWFAQSMRIKARR